MFPKVHDDTKNFNPRCRISQSSQATTADQRKTRLDKGEKEAQQVQQRRIEQISTTHADGIYNCTHCVSVHKAHFGARMIDP